MLFAGEGSRQGYTAEDVKRLDHHVRRRICVTVDVTFAGLATSGAYKSPLVEVPEDVFDLQFFGELLR